MTKAVKFRVASRPRRRRSDSPREVSAVALARHLDFSRAYLGKLEAAGVIHRETGGGFPLEVSRVAYIRHLRHQRQQSPKSAAESELQKAKTALIWLRVGEREGRLIELSEAIETVEALTGLFRTHLSGLAAQCSRDLPTRRVIDAAVDAMLHKIADEAGKRAAELERPPECDEAGGRR